MIIIPLGQLPTVEHPTPHFCTPFQAREVEFSGSLIHPVGDVACDDQLVTEPSNRW